MDENMVGEKLVTMLEKGKELATQMMTLIHHHHHHHHDQHDGLLKGQLDAHSFEVFNSITSALSMLHYFLALDYHNQCLKWPNPTPETTSKAGRGCYKRRKTEQAVETETLYMENDGYTWRKYGQKIIQHMEHPRNYYRCTHKIEQGCQATKQVQQVSDNPPKYKITYQGSHTCKEPITTFHHNYLDMIDEQHNSPFLLSFGTPNNPQHAFNPCMFPSSSSTPTSTTVSPIEDYQPVMEDIPSEPLDHQHGGYVPPLSPSDFLCNPTTTSFVFDDVIPMIMIDGVQEDFHYPFVHD